MFNIGNRNGAKYDKLHFSSSCCDEVSQWGKAACPKRGILILTSASHIPRHYPYHHLQNWIISPSPLPRRSLLINVVYPRPRDDLRFSWPRSSISPPDAQEAHVLCHPKSIIALTDILSCFACGPRSCGSIPSRSIHSSSPAQHPRTPSLARLFIAKVTREVGTTGRRAH